MSPFRTKNTFCSYCGNKFTAKSSFPRTCENCGNITYINPIPVSILIQPVKNRGILLIRRGLEPGKGRLALPGGFVDFGESWQEAGARELSEEAGISVSSSGISEFRIISSEEGRLVLIFGIGREILESEMPVFVPSEESTERVIVNSPEELAFPLHTKVLKEYFDSHDKI